MLNRDRRENSAWMYLFFAWLVALSSLLGSLFFSEVMGFVPCELCWFQRICLYPLAIILVPALMSFDRQVWRYSMPLVFIGWLLALYHNLLYYKLIPNTAAPCREGVSCSTEYINWLGFITIPLLSLAAFSAIMWLMIMSFQSLRK